VYICVSKQLRPPDTHDFCEQNYAIKQLGYIQQMSALAVAQRQRQAEDRNEERKRKEQREPMRREKQQGYSCS
jgi:hypothetical protein